MMFEVFGPPGDVLAGSSVTWNIQLITSHLNEYSHDDGSAELDSGNPDPGFHSVVSLVHFDRVTGAGVITAIRVDWGGGQEMSGDPVDVVVWDDPDGDGDPTDARVLQLTPTTLQDDGLSIYVTVPIPPTRVGPSFFVGTRWEGAGPAFPRSLDATDPDGESWFADGVGSVPLDDLSAATFFGNVTDTDFMIRAVPEPGAVLQQLAILGVLAGLARSRHRGCVQKGSSS
jgi:hypothetical protein